MIQTFSDEPSRDSSRHLSASSELVVDKIKNYYSFSLETEQRHDKDTFRSAGEPQWQRSMAKAVISKHRHNFTIYSVGKFFNHFIWLTNWGMSWEQQPHQRYLCNKNSNLLLPQWTFELRWPLTQTSKNQSSKKKIKDKTFIREENMEKSPEEEQMPAAWHCCYSSHYFGVFRCDVLDQTGDFCAVIS